MAHKRADSERPILDVTVLGSIAVDAVAANRVLPIALKQFEGPANRRTQSTPIAHRLEEHIAQRFTGLGDPKRCGLHVIDHQRHRMHGWGACIRFAQHVRAVFLDRLLWVDADGLTLTNPHRFVAWHRKR